MAYKDKEKEKEYNKKWYEANKDAIKKRMQLYYEEHKEIRAKQHREWAKNNKEHLKQYRKNNIVTIKKAYRKSQLKRLYGLTVGDYEVMHNKQNGKCFICENVSTNKLCVDHNHITGKVRKLLCDKCNNALGLFNDNVALMERAIQYLKDHNA